MRIWNIALSTAVGVLVFSSVATAQAPRSAGQIVDEEVLMRFFEEPESHFHKAREQFFQRRFKASAQSIRTAAGYVKLESALASPKGEELVRASAAELDRLADGVEGRSVKSAQAMDQAFASAHYAMGKNHNLKAVEHMAHGRTKAAGRQLQAAVHHASHGYQWAGIAEKDDAHAIFKKAAEVSRSMTEKAKDVSVEMKDAANALNDRLEQIAHKLHHLAKN
jgi:hypothetical protein